MLNHVVVLLRCAVDLQAQHIELVIEHFAMLKQLAAAVRVKTGPT
jgi:uncharacterized coiled-coil protein SlyX